MRFGESTIIPLTRQLTERLGLDWKRRLRLLVSRQARLPQLAKNDEGMMHRVEGLRCLGKSGLEGVQARLKEEIVPRDLFSLTVQSCVTSDVHCFMACVALAEAMPHLHGAFIAAMEWVEPVQLYELMEGWRTDSELHRLTNLQLLADARFDDLNISSAISEVRTQAEQRLLLRAARLRTRPDWVRVSLEKNVTALSDGELQWELCAHHLLFGGASERGQLLEQACEHVRRSQEAEIEWWITLLASEPGQCGERVVQTLSKYIGISKCYIIGLGWLGKIQCIPELIDLLDDSSLARVAAQTISMLTGSMPEKDGWQQATDAMSTDKNQTNDQQRDSDSHLPWPDKERFLPWWDEHRKEFDADALYLLGRKREPRELVDLLREASLTWRPAAAWMLQRQKPAMALDTNATAFRQIMNLAHLEQLVEPNV